MDKDYSVSPDGRLSILINSDNHEIHIGRHQNDSSTWPPLRIYGNTSWNYLLHKPSDINNELNEILAVVAIDMDRFVYVGSTKTDDVQIGVIKIESIDENFVLLTELNFRKLDIFVNDLILCYDIQLGFNVYLSTLSHFVVYNFENFEYRSINCFDTANMTILSDPLNLLILDQTHFLISTDASDYSYFGVIIALIEINLNRSSLDLSVISYELINLSDIEYLKDPIEHISLSMNIYGNILIGLPEINRVLFVDFNMNERRFISNNRTFLMKTKPKSFGYSVLWLSDQYQFAVNAYDDSHTDLIYSQIYVFNYNDEQLWIRSIFPNNQQIKSIPNKSFYFHNLILLNGILFGIIASRGGTELIVLIFPSISGGRGMFDLDFDLSIEEFFPYLFARIEPCLPGTYKNDKKSIGPCFLCPIGTKASTYGNLECQSCVNPLKCSLGSIKDQDEYPRIIQTVNYPESSDSTAFDDIILSNMFSFQCLVISPVFWTFITIIIVILFPLIGYFPRISRYRLKILHSFKHIDLIGHGQLWIGGIVSCGICVFVIFSVLFSMNFIHLYPFEEIKR